MTSGTLEQQILEAVGVLKGEGVVAFPTDTLYGLGASIYSQRAVERVFQIKGRPQEMALPVLLSRPEQLEEVALEVSPMAHRLARAFWPGPLTLVVQKSPRVPSLVTAGRETVAVRVPNHQVPRALVEGLGAPLTGTSANPSGGPDPVTAEDVRRLLGTQVDYIVDGGPAPLGRPSTVVDVTGDTLRVLRARAVSVQQLQEVVGSWVEIIAR